MIHPDIKDCERVEREIIILRKRVQVLRDAINDSLAVGQIVGYSKTRCESALKNISDRES